MSKLIAVVEPSVPDSDPHSYHIEILGGKFKGIVYKFGGVSITEENDDAQMHFSYDVVSGAIPTEDKSEFESFIGDRLIEMLEEQLKERSVVYNGGVADAD